MAKHWHEQYAGCETGVEDWQTLLRSGKPIDPYLVWADLSGALKRYFTEKLKVPLLVELTENWLPVPSRAGDSCPADHACELVFGFLDIPNAYTAVADHASPRPYLVSRFITARADVDKIGEILRHGDKIARFQLGVARLPFLDFKSQVRSSGAGAGRPRVVVGVIDDGFAFAHSQFRHVADGTPRVAFLWDQDAGRKDTNAWTRVPEFAGYGAELRLHAIETLLKCETIGPLAPYEAADYAPRKPDLDRRATSLYDSDRAHVRASVATMSTAAHGTSVAYLAAGNDPALPTRRVADRRGVSSLEERDAAENWPLVLVQLPTRTTLDTSGGSLGVHLLDGIRYIVRRAEAIAEEAPGGNPSPKIEVKDQGNEVSETYFPSNRVVINVSYGAIAGPHDGTSILEKAITDLVDQRPHTFVVLSAGNANGSRTHARVELTHGAPSKRLTWRVGPENLLESYLEVWLPSHDIDGHVIEPKALQQVTCILKSPSGEASAPVSTAGRNVQLLHQRNVPNGRPIAGAIASARVAQGEYGTMFLLVVGSTALGGLGAASSASAPPAAAPHGEWQVDLAWGVASAAGPLRAMVVHAWAERNDRLWGNVRRQQSTVVGDDRTSPPTEYMPSVIEQCRRVANLKGNEDVPEPYQPDITFGSISGVRKAGKNVVSDVFVVGAYRLADGEVAAYSGAGPARGSAADSTRVPGGDCTALGQGGRQEIGRDDAPRHGPDVDAPGDVGAAVRGLPTIGLREGSTARLSGTSAAAPLLTRALANELSAALSRSTHGKLERRPQGSLPAEDHARRPTLAPTRDDRFRRGRDRLTWKE